MSEDGAIVLDDNAVNALPIVRDCSLTILADSGLSTVFGLSQIYFVRGEVICAKVLIAWPLLFVLFADPTLALSNGHVTAYVAC